MGTTFSEFDITSGALISELRTRILASTDWSDISFTSQLATFTTAYAAGATGVLNITSLATNHQWASTGQALIIDKGLPTEERVSIVARNSLTQLQINTNLQFAHVSGATIHSASALLKATTTEGAQMVLDLGDNWRPNGLMMAVYRTHDGTTGVDKLQRYASYKNSGTATINDIVHCVLSAGKDHIFLSVEGPRAGETNADSATAGSKREYLFLGSMLPYFGTDVVPAVVLSGNMNSSLIAMNEVYCQVSRNFANTLSWVTARLGTIAFPGPAVLTNGPTVVATLAQLAQADGNHYFFPFVVIEQVGGLRGRLKSVFDAGYNTSGLPSEPVFIPGQRFTVSGVDYVTVMPIRGGVSNQLLCPFGFASTASASTAVQTVVMVPR